MDLGRGKRGTQGPGDWTYSALSNWSAMVLVVVDAMACRSERG